MNVLKQSRSEIQFHFLPLMPRFTLLPWRGALFIPAEEFASFGKQMTELPISPHDTSQDNSSIRQPCGTAGHPRAMSQQ